MALVAAGKGDSLQHRPRAACVAALFLGFTPILRQLQRGLPRRAAHHVGRRRDRVRAAADPQQPAWLGLPRPQARPRASSGARLVAVAGIGLLFAHELQRASGRRRRDRRRHRPHPGRHARRVDRQRLPGAARKSAATRCSALLAWSMAAGALIDAVLAFAIDRAADVRRRARLLGRLLYLALAGLGPHFQPLLSRSSARSARPRRPIRA